MESIDNYVPLIVIFRPCSSTDQSKNCNSMPRPRFQKLSDSRRERIMEAAAREFAAHGFHNASLNRILQEASISKGAAYYYFDDKADLFATTVTFYAGGVLDSVAPALEEVDGETFWPTVFALYEVQLDAYVDRPWALGAIKAAARLSPEEIAADDALQELLAQVEGQLQMIIGKGQEAGVIRRDLPQDLLMRLFMAVDDAMDRWLLENWEGSQMPALRQTVRRTLQGLARFMAPAEAQ